MANITLNLYSPLEWVLLLISLFPLIRDAIVQFVGNVSFVKIVSSYSCSFNTLFMLDRILNLATVILIVVYIIKLSRSTNPIALKITLPIIMFMFFMFAIVHVLEVWNCILGALSTNPPINLNKNDYFPNHQLWESNFGSVRKEILSIVERGDIPCFDEVISRVSALVERKNGNCWRWKFLKVRGEINEEALVDCLVVKELLKDPMIANASISILDPNVSIAPHRGYFKGFLRYHLCIETSDDDENKPFIVCGGETYSWKTGEGVMLDDMYVHHVVNNSNHRRIVIFMDIKRTDLPAPIGYISEKISDIIDAHPLLQFIIKTQHKQIKNNS